MLSQSMEARCFTQLVDCLKNTWRLLQQLQKLCGRTAKSLGSRLVIEIACDKRVQRFRDDRGKVVMLVADLNAPTTGS